MSKSNVQRGYNLKIKLGTPTATELAYARDVSFTLNTSEEADISVKADGLAEDWIGTAKNLEGSADELLCDEAEFDDLKTAWLNDTDLEFEFEWGLDEYGAADTVSGTCGITSIENPHELRGAVVSTFNFKSRGQVLGFDE